MVNLDLAATSKKIIGLDYNAFAGVSLDTLTVLSNYDSQFVVHNGALVDTGLQRFEYSSGIKPAFNQGSTNNTFEKVVIS